MSARDASRKGSERELTAVKRKGDGERHVGDESERLRGNKGDWRETENTQVEHVIEADAEVAVVGFDDLGPARASNESAISLGTPRRRTAWFC